MTEGAIDLSLVSDTAEKVDVAEQEVKLGGIREEIDVTELGETNRLPSISRNMDFPVTRGSISGENGGGRCCTPGNMYRHVLSQRASLVSVFVLSHSMVI